MGQQFRFWVTYSISHRRATAANRAGCVVQLCCFYYSTFGFAAASGFTPTVTTIVIVPDDCHQYSIIRSTEFFVTTRCQSLIVHRIYD